MPVSIATCHHEGAGTPSDDPRGAAGGYSYWIGATKWERLRSPYVSYATLAYNHVSFDFCLSGDRDVADVTDTDIALIRGAFLDCHAQGEIVDQPRVQLHCDNNGLYYYQGSLFSTVCPGTHAVAKRHQIEAACRFVATPPSLDPRLTQWAERVQHTPLRYGMQSPEVAMLVDLLREKRFLTSNVHGDKYGNVLKGAVEHWKRTHPQVGNTDGKNFGPEAAIVLINS